MYFLGPYTLVLVNSKSGKDAYTMHTHKSHLFPT